MKREEPELMLCTTIELSYRGKVLFETQIDGILNDADLKFETDMKALPVCSKCKKSVVWHTRLKDGLCKKCFEQPRRDDEAAVQQMFDIGYW